MSLLLTDTEECAAVRPTGRGLIVTSQPQGDEAVRITAASRHIIAVTKVRLLDRWLITGPVRDKGFQGLVSDLLARRVKLGGLVTHYAAVMQFPWLVNLRATPTRK